MLIQLIAGGLLFFFPSQAPQKSAEDPTVLLERAAVAEKVGDLTKAGDLLARAWTLGDPAVKRTVEARQVELRKKLGVAASEQEKDIAQSRPSILTGTPSPLQRRFNGAISNYLTGALQSAEMSEIAGLTGDDGLPILGDWIEDGETSTADIARLFSAVAMIAQRNPSSRAPIDFLLKYSKSNDAYIRRRALTTFPSLSIEGSPWGMELATQFARDPDPETRTLAVKLFASNGDAVKPFLSQLARDPSPDVRGEVAWRFASILGSAERARLLEDKNAWVLARILDSVKGDSWPDAGNALLTLAQCEDPEVVQKAAEISFKKGFPGAKPEAVVPVLTRLSKSPNVHTRRQVGVRSRAIQELEALGVPIILARVNDEDETISRDALTVFDNLPADSRSRDYMAAACAAVKEVAARYPLDSKDRSGGQSGDNFVRGFGNYVTMAAKPEDLGLLLTILTLFPDPGTRQQRTTQAILNLATDKNLTLLQGFLETCKESDLRMEVLRRILQIAKFTQGGVKLDLVPALRTASAGDPSMQYTALVGILELGLGELEKEILTIVDRVDAKLLEQLDFRPLFANAPEVAMRALIRTIERREKVGNTLPTSNIDYAYRVVGECTGEKTANVVMTFLLNDDFWTLVFQGKGRAVGADVERVVENLGRLTAPAGSDALKRLYNESKTLTVRAASVKAMGIPKDPDLTRFLVEKVLTDGSTFLRGVGVGALRDRSAYDDDTVQQVAKLLTDSSVKGDTKIAGYFTQWKSPKAIPYLRVLLKVPNSNIRTSACNALGLFMSEDPVPDLLELLADPDKDVRATAKDALERIRFYNDEKRRWQEWNRAGGETPAEGLRKLLTSLDDKDVDVRIAAAESLGTMKSKEALPTLVDKLKSTPPGAERDALTKAIAKINQ